MDVATLAAMLLLAPAVLLAVVWFVLPAYASRTCAACGMRVPVREAACGVCGAAMEPPAAHPAAAAYGFPPPGPARRERARLEGGEAFNRGITRRVVTLATLAMGMGIGLRLLGMFGALGLPQVPLFLDGLLTIAGGVLAFVGFVFLDAA